MSNDLDQNGITGRTNTLINKQPPIWQELVIELFFRPRKFFSDLSILKKTQYVVAVTWIFGISEAIDKVDQEMIKAELNPSRNSAGLLTGFVDPWVNYWGFVLAYGALAALFVWWIGGWWYRKRLEWSGVADPDHRLVRIIYIYASFVVSAPVVILAVIQSAVYDNYSQSYHAEGLWPLIILIFPFWSLVVSYIGVRTTFDVSKWRARTWFIILPGILYVVLFGGLTALYALMPALQSG